MKKTTHLLLMILLLTPMVWGQQEASNLDTAAQIIQRHYELMNYEAIPHDSMVYIESHIVFTDQPTDTLTMHRWYVWPFRYRLEIIQGDSLITGYRNDGKDEYMKYDIHKDEWGIVNAGYYMDRMTSYDFRGPLYNWKMKGGELRYEGKKDYHGQLVNSIYVVMPGTYDKHYIFEEESGLLFLFNETNKTIERTEFAQISHIDWRAYLEYERVGASLFVSQERYKQDGVVVEIQHHAQILPIDDRLFTHNKRLTMP